VVVAPGDIQECFEFTFKAFNYGDRYQMPVIVLLDRVLANSFWTVDEINVEGLEVDPGELFSQNGTDIDDSPFKRHVVTASGVSPRSIPGEPRTVFVTTSDEHTESGKISEGIENRLEQMDKRMRKLDLMASETPESDKWTLYGPDQADATIVSWGSTMGAIIDSMRVLDEDLGIRVNFLQIRLMKPFPTEEVTRLLSAANKLILIEDNYSGQLGDLIREKTGIKIDLRVLKYDGRPISQNEVEEGVANAAKLESGRFVMSHP
jgi:2-oxoglutarate ferredoxin oxidoreductase subunit alpha